MTNGEVVNTKKNANLSEKGGLLWLWKNLLQWCQIIWQRLWLKAKGVITKKKYLAEKDCKNESRFIQNTIWGRNT